MIVSAHAHIGDSRVFDADNTEEELIEAMDQAGVHVSIVMPSAGCANAAAVHDRIARMAKAYPQRIFGMVQINPHTDHQVYWAEARRCVEDLGFVGVKIHPLGYAVNPRSRDAEMVFQVAKELSIPVMIHTGSGLPWSLPSLWIPLAQRYAGVPVVLAHAGMGIFTAEAHLTAELCPNVFLETSWAKPGELQWLVNSLGAERIMMGGDLNSNLPVEVFKFRSLKFSQRQLDQCLAGTAIQVFRLPLEWKQQDSMLHEQ